MNTQGETAVSTITEIPQNPTNNEENWSQRLKPAAIGIFSVSLALWIIILMFAIIAVIPLTQLIVGIIHKDGCSMNYLIPIYLIVAGAIGLTMIIISIIQNVLRDQIIWLCLQIIFVLFHRGWFIAGCVWVFRAKSKVQSHNPSETSTYCNSVAFNCAYVTLILTIISLFSPLIVAVFLKYFTSMSGLGNQWNVCGYGAIYNPTKTSFTIYTQLLTLCNNAITLNSSQMYRWDVNWFGILE